MKTHTRTLPALAALIFLTGAAGSTSRGQTWQTILDLGPGTYGHDVLANPFPTSPLPIGMFVTADIFSSPECETVFMDTAQPQSASNPSVVVPSTGLINRLGFDSTLGALYSVGYIRKPDNSLAWDTRRSLDDGQTWLDLDSGWQLNAGAPAQATGFAADVDGNLFACGTASDRKGKTYAILRKSVDHGVTWSTSVINVSVAIHSVPANPQNQGGLFTVGSLGSNLWGVQRSRDGGTTWTTVDSWGPSKNGAAVATAITSDVGGTIYVAGHATQTLQSLYGWYVKTSSDAGASWKTLLADFSAGTGQSFVDDITVDSAGNLWVVGGINADTVNETWTMLRWNPSAGWSGPLFPYANSAPRSRAKGVASGSGSAGKVYATGGVYDSAGFAHATLLEITN